LNTWTETSIQSGSDLGCLNNVSEKFFEHVHMPFTREWGTHWVPGWS
jgi:hypothetical protein